MLINSSLQKFSLVNLVDLPSIAQGQMVAKNNMRLTKFVSKFHIQSEVLNNAIKD